MSNGDRKNGVPANVTSIPLVDPHAPKPDPSIGDLVKDATSQVSTLVRAEVALAKAEVTRDVKKGLTGSVFFILALVVLFYSTFFLFFFLAELIHFFGLYQWAAYLIVFGAMVLTTALLAFLGYLKVRRIRGPQKTIESVKEAREALVPGGAAPAATSSRGAAPAATSSRGAAPAATSSRGAAPAATSSRGAAPAATSSRGAAPAKSPSESAVDPSGW